MGLAYRGEGVDGRGGDGGRSGDDGAAAADVAMVEANQQER